MTSAPLWTRGQNYDDEYDSWKKRRHIYVGDDDYRLFGAFEGILLGSWDATYVGIMNGATDGDSLDAFLFIYLHFSGVTPFEVRQST